MRVALITPWRNAWVPYFKKAIEARGHEFVLNGGGDVVLHGWASGDSVPLAGARNIMFMRRYELFEGGLQRVDWKQVDALICVNSWIKEVVQTVFAQSKVKTPVHLIYNGTDLSRWRYRERKPSKKIGMACHIHPKKNLPLAVQVLAHLPEDYELHIAGDIQDSCTAEYLNHVGARLRRKVYLYGHVHENEMSLWWEQMGFCLSTSLSEGNPNNVIEAMAKGIKPVVHAWPGADDQFPDYLFDTAEQAAKMILDERYESASYRRLIEEKFSLANIEKVLDLAVLEETCV